ncbi:MAG: hypothetical protein A2Y38_02675 [Spirochaetes bacterium GWB1_59_5]|nr:MAG: hypothetical protein A2Y38_02675 [Spirochaetes bacterium GWB1_59_5]
MGQASQHLARRYLRKQAAIVGTDTAEIIAIAPEMLRHLVDGTWLEAWGTGDFERADRLVVQHGGAVFHTEGDGHYDVKVPKAHGWDGAVHPGLLRENRVAARYLRKLAADQDEFLLPFPEARQSTEFTCGAAAAQAVLYYYGHEYREEQLVKALGTTTEGTDTGAIVRVLLGAKLSVYAGRMSLGHVKWCLRQGFPVILVIQAWGEAVAEENRQVGYDRNQDGHYVVAIGYKAGHIICEDPSVLSNRGVIPEVELDERWHDEKHGIVLDHFGIVAMGTPQYDPHLMRRIEA